MAGTLNDVLAVARRNLGFIEGKNNENPYAPLVGHANNQPWCASFVAAVFKRAGVRLPNTSPYTPTMAGGFKNEDRWYSSGRVGDLVFFQWPSMGRIAHVGIVERVELTKSGPVYTCIEGNTDSAGGRTGGRVMRQLRRANIAGFGRPVYATRPTGRPLTNVPPGLSPQLGLMNPPLYGPKIADIHRAFIKLDPANRARLGNELAKQSYGPLTSKLVTTYKKNRRIQEPGFGPLCWERIRKDIAP